MADGPRLTRRTRSIAQKQGVRRRRFTVGIGLVAAVLVLLAAGWLFLVPAIPFFQVDKTTVRGLGKDRSGDVAEVEAAVRQSVEGMSTLNPDEGNLEEAMSRFPRVAGVSVVPDFPDEATVEVDLRRDGSVAEASPDDLLIATDGWVLERFDEKRSGPLPVLGAGPVSQVPGERLEGEALNQALVAGAAPAELRQFIELIESGDSGVEAQLTDGSVLVFGDASEVRAKWAAAATVIADPELTGGISAIDLSVPGRPGVTLGDGTVIETEVSTGIDAG